ncbi:MAG: HD domain-containing protein, partial [Deltaproteobacteria bacterium]|nr:HD domain-containing protein [Deltaproteobacteria bacterium]
MISARPRGLIGELSQARESLFQAHLSGASGAVVVQRCTDWVEGVIKRLFNEALARYPAYRPVGLVAVGGFGRGELNLHSDVDLLFLYPADLEPDLEPLAQQVLYPLWDLNLDVGHAARTVDECLELAAEDFSVLVSMLTARTVTGSPDLASKLAQELMAALSSARARREFLAKVEAAERQRRERFGHTPYLLEPHLKEGEGGLRDIHTITWLGLGCFEAKNLRFLLEKGLMTDEEVTFISSARDFLWRVRNHLHYLAKGRDDRLTFERQQKVAAFLGFKEEGGISRVERFMRDYYTRTFNLRNIRDIVLERVGTRLSKGSKGKAVKVLEKNFLAADNKLGLADPGRIQDNPALMMRLFAVSARSGIEVSHQARQEVRLNRNLVDDDFRRDPAIRQDFLTALMPPRPEAGAFVALHGSGLLNAYLPELEGVFQLPQHDAYHIYTVDAHLLRTVDRLARLKEGQGSSEGERLARDLLSHVTRPRLLYLAALLHDLGKTRGKGHSERGARLA